MRILILTQYYLPEPVFKFADLARGLVARGHEVQVITGFPCFPRGKTYEGYRQRLFTEDRMDGVLVTRVPQAPDHSRSAVRRAWYYLTFALSAATIGLWRARPADVLLVYQAAFPIGFSAWVISRAKRIPYVLDVVDLWPESVAAAGVSNRLVLTTIRHLVNFIYRGARRINVITAGYRRNLLAMGVLERKLALIHYWSPAGQFDPVPYDAELAQAEGLAGRFNVMYSGIMGPVQDLRTVIDTAALLRDLPTVQFVMVGDGVEADELRGLAAERRVDNVRFLGRRSAGDVQRLFPLADALLVHLKSDPVSNVSIPSKTYAYMAAGRPILMAVEGEASELVESHHCGITVRPSDPAALADAVRRLAAMPRAEREELGQVGLQAYRANYHSELQIQKFADLLRSAVCEPERNRLRHAA